MAHRSIAGLVRRMMRRSTLAATGTSLAGRNSLYLRCYLTISGFPRPAHFLNYLWRGNRERLIELMPCLCKVKVAFQKALLKTRPIPVGFLVWLTLPGGGIDSQHMSAIRRWSRL